MVSDGMVQVVKEVSLSVVQISNGHRGFGSGVVWDVEGHIVTNAHVVGRSETVRVSFSQDGGEETHEGKVIEIDRFSDVAVVHIDNLPKTILHPIQRGDSSMLSTGQLVFALANPFGGKVSATFGIITNASARIGGRTPWADDVVVTDARLNPGYSGGPLVDVFGKMIGMNAAYFTNRGISIPANQLNETVRDLLVEGGVKRAYLGIVSDSISLPEDVAEQIKQEEGLLVYSVELGTPAKKAGVAVGDIVVRLDSKPVRNYYDLRRILTSKIIGKETSLSILRGEKLTELLITPIEA